ncbi:lipopolysaccharide biosynthesis protein [Pseudarcicella hirudinis]
MMFGSVISMPSQQLARISGTVIADAWRNNDLDNILKVYQKSCINQLLIGGLVFIGIIANLHNVFAILPPEYATGKWVIIIIGIGQIFDMFTGVNGIILSTSKYYYFDSIFMILLIFGTWQLNEALIPEYGITGSAIATALSILAFNSFRTFFVWYKFGMQPFSLHNLYILIIMAAVYFLSMLLPVVPGFAGIPGFLIDTPIRSALITGVFIFTVYTLKISPEINTLLDSSIKKILQLLKR